MACFHREGNDPVTIEVFSIHVRYVMITGKDSFKKRSGMPSQPHEDVFLKCFITRIIVLLSVGSGRNMLPAGKLVWSVLTCSILSLYGKLHCDFWKVCFPTLAKSIEIVAFGIYFLSVSCWQWTLFICSGECELPQRAPSGGCISFFGFKFLVKVIWLWFMKQRFYFFLSLIYILQVYIIPVFLETHLYVIPLPHEVL